METANIMDDIPLLMRVNKLKTVYNDLITAGQEVLIKIINQICEINKGDFITDIDELLSTFYKYLLTHKNKQDKLTKLEKDFNVRPNQTNTNTTYINNEEYIIPKLQPQPQPVRQLPNVISWDIPFRRPKREPISYAPGVR